jgi:AraC family transcriptional regulator
MPQTIPPASGSGTPVLLSAGRHHGAPTRARRVGRFLVSETRYSPRQSTPWHAHERAALCLVTAGAYLERFGRAAFECTPSSVVFRPAAVVHLDLVGAGGAACFIVEPDGGWLADVGAAAPPPGPLHSRRGRAAWLLRHALAECRSPDALSALAVEGLVLAAFADVTRSAERGERPTPPWLRRVRDALHDRHAERLSLGALAALAGVHPVHLATSFRRAFGVTVGEYARRVRVDAARRALAGDRPISRVAADLGFASPSHFARVFARQTGVTPSAYRAMRRKLNPGLAAE